MALLNEASAWKWIAQEVFSGEDGEYPQHRGSYSICVALGTLNWQGKISRTTVDKMRATIDKEGKRRGKGLYSYWWSRFDGKSRKEWCMWQSELAARRAARKKAAPKAKAKRKSPAGKRS